MKSQLPPSLWQQIKHLPFFIKLMNWEYWPMWITNLPLFFIWLFFSIRSKSLFFFSRVNPVIETGGFFGESKINIFNRIPAQYIPKTLFIAKETPSSLLTKLLDKEKPDFPLILKPNVGERGLRVKKVNSTEELFSYHESSNFDYLIQEYIAYPLEVCILYYRFPEAKSGVVTSICIKETLKVSGDGISTVNELMKKKPRAKLQLDRFAKEKAEILKIIPKKKEILELEPIGNHSKGTKFLNGNQHIDKAMISTFDKVGFGMKDIYYGRFDIKCKSIEDIKKGKNFKILEFNGVGSEPGHIYDPDVPIFKKYLEMYRHWKVIYQISEIQKTKGVEAISSKEIYKILSNHLSHISSLSA